MLVVNKDFRQQVGATFLSFEAGKVIDNPGLEIVLLASLAPVTQVEDRRDLIQCPHCRRQFTVKQAVDAERPPPPPTGTTPVTMFHPPLPDPPPKKGK